MEEEEPPSPASSNITVLPPGRAEFSDAPWHKDDVSQPAQTGTVPAAALKHSAWGPWPSDSIKDEEQEGKERTAAIEAL